MPLPASRLNAAKASISDSLVTSQTKARPPISLAKRFNSSALRPATTTFAPSAANRRAITWPILSRPAAPSTTAVLLFSCPIVPPVQTLDGPVGRMSAQRLIKSKRACFLVRPVRSPRWSDGDRPHPWPETLGPPQCAAQTRLAGPPGPQSPGPGLVCLPARWRG